MSALITKACGKVMVVGEYAVLFGCPAIVIPSTKQAICTFTSKPRTTLRTHDNSIDTTLLETVIETSQNAGLTLKSGEFIVDTSDFFNLKSKQKLGLGSSAAATVALTKMILWHNNIDDQALLLSLSLKSHKKFSNGLGSGADVASSVYKKPLLFSLTTIKEISLNQFFENIIVIGTPRSQNTREFVQKIVSLTHHDFMAKFVAQSNKHVLALKHARTHEQFVDSMDESLNLVLSLAEQAKIEVMTKEHEAIRLLAKSLGGTAKPSGAGGGDIAIAYLKAENREIFVDKLQAIAGCFVI